MSEPKPKQTKNAGDVLRCSFCNKSQRDVKKLIAGPTVYICDECIGICLDILNEDGVTLTPQQLVATLIPEQILHAAEGVMPGQQEAKRVIASALVQHGSRLLEDGKQPGLSPLFLVGATGVGKSQLVTAMGTAAGFAVTTIEAPLLFADSPFKAKMDFPGFDTKPGVVIINKMESIAARDGKADEYRRVQESIISIIDGAALPMPGGAKLVSRESTLDTSRTLFIALAALPDLPGDDIASALVQHGYLPELVVRFGTFVRLQSLNDREMTELLTRDKGLITDCKNRFAKYGIQVEVEPLAVEEIVKLGVSRNAGVRGLKALMDRLGIALACEKIPEGGQLTVDAAYVARNLR